MRLTFVPAALLALVWAGAADACCFFKCCKKSYVESVSPASPEKRIAAPSLVVATVGGYAPNSSYEITQLIPEGTVIVVVQKDPDTLNPTLHLKELATVVTVKEFKVVRSRRLESTPSGGVIYEVEYEIRVSAGKHYAVWAVDGAVESHKVTFRTR